MNRKIKMLLLVIPIFLCGIIRANAALQCNSGWSVVQFNNKNYCCPNGWKMAHFSDGKDSCYKDARAISKNDCEAMGGSHAAIYTECTITPKTPTQQIFTMTFHKNDTSKTPATWTSNGSGRPDGSNVVASCQTTGSSCQISSAPTITRTHYSFKGWSTKSDCSSLATSLRFPVSIDKNYALYACWNEIPACYVCGSSSGGGYYYGNYAESNSCNYYSNENKATCEAHNGAPVEQQKQDDFTGSSGGSDSGGSGTGSTGAILTYYKITYDLDGGHYIDGSTTRTQIVRGDKAVGDFKTIPVKKGQSFIEWQYNGTKFNSSTKLNDVASSIASDGDGFKNITLKAIYTEYDDADLVYCDNEKAELDLTTKKCYTTLKEDTSQNIFTHTTYTWNAGHRYCESDGTISIEINPDKTEGKANKNDGVYTGYEKDTWLSQNSCLSQSECSGSQLGECTMRWDAILYKVVDAKTKDKTYEKDTSFDDNSRKSDNEAGAMGPTGDALIYIIFALGLGSLGYTVYYFQKKKKMANI